MFNSDLKPPPILYAATLLCWYTGLAIIKVSSITLATFLTVSGALHCLAYLRTQRGTSISTLAVVAELRTLISCKIKHMTVLISVIFCCI